MKPFKIIQGNLNNISKFEDDISQAIEDGYEFSNDLICKETQLDGKSQIILLQPMTIEESLEFENEELDYNDNE